MTIRRMLPWVGCLLALAVTWTSAGKLCGQDYVMAQYLPPSWRTHCFARLEYLAWWVQGNKLPPLVTTSPDGTPRADAGVLGVMGTEVVVGNERINERIRQGGRVTFGSWFNDSHTLGWEAHWFGIGDGSSENFLVTSDGSPIVARPFFNTATNAQDAQLVAYPLVDDGTELLSTASETYSIGITGRMNWLRGPAGYVDLYGGYRYFRFRETLSIRESLTTTNPAGAVALGSAIFLFDDFAAENDFNALEVGAIVGLQHGFWTLDIISKVAVGDMYQRLKIDGFTHVTEPGNPLVETPGGLLTQPTNIGKYSDHEFAVMPEIGVQLKLVPNDVIQFNFGYNLLYATKILRTGNQIDLRVDPSQLAPGIETASNSFGAGTPAPLPRLVDTSMWLMGFSTGIELRW